MSRIFPGIYLHRFSCGHSESHHGILVNDKNNLTLDHPCVRCEPNTPAGQERLKAMSNWSKFSIPFVTEDGDIIMAPRMSKYHPALLSIREKGDRYEVSMWKQDSAEAMIVNSIDGGML